jgi:uncharacterized lipoprotein YbaY
MRTLSIAAVAALLLAGCAAGSSLSGTVTPASVAGFGPEASAVQVSLVEQASGRIVASQTVLIEGRSTVAFSLRPDAPAGEYDLRARVTDRSGAVLYRSEDDVRVAIPSTEALDVTVEPAQTGG